MIVGAFMIFTVNLFKALMFVIFLLALQQVEGNLIYPRVVGAKMNLPAMWVLAAITSERLVKNRKAANRFPDK